MNFITTYWASLSPTTKRYIVTGVHVFLGTFGATLLLDYKNVLASGQVIDLNLIVTFTSTAASLAVKALGEYVVGNYVSTAPTGSQKSN